jgi:hypothetical protein
MPAVATSPVTKKEVRPHALVRLVPRLMATEAARRVGAETGNVVFGKIVEAEPNQIRQHLPRTPGWATANPQVDAAFLLMLDTLSSLFIRFRGWPMHPSLGDRPSLRCMGMMRRHHEPWRGTQPVVSHSRGRHMIQQRCLSFLSDMIGVRHSNSEEDDEEGLNTSQAGSSGESLEELAPAE